MASAKPFTPATVVRGQPWTGPDGTVYNVVFPYAVGNQLRWWLVAAELGNDGVQWWPDRAADLHFQTAEECGGAELALVVR